MDVSLMRLDPALVGTRLRDYSLHQLLLEAILTPAASQSYAATLRYWPFAPVYLDVLDRY